MSTIDETLSFLQGFARDALGRASTLSGRIPSGFSGGGIEGAQMNHTPSKPRMEKPPAFSDLVELPDESADAVRVLDANAEKWVSQYFPELQACLRTTPEKWLCGILTGASPLGMSDAAFEAVWHAGRDRAYRQATAEKAQIKHEFSARGFSVPTGAMVGALTDAEVRASDAVADVNRQQTTKDAELKLDLLKFAEEQAIELKIGVLRALASFHAQWAQIPDRSIEKLRVRAQMYASMQQAMSSYYNVELGFEELRLRAAEAKAGTAVSNDTNRIRAQNVALPGDAMATAVRGFADAAAAAANAQSTFAAQVESGSL